MVEARELVTICRQIGGMMEAGVDILRVIRVLRAQTTNPRLLAVFEDIDHALRLGASVSEAMERAPDVFSPFAVSLVREGEARRDIPGAFLRIADFLQQEEETAPIFEPKPPSLSQVNIAYLGDRSPVTVGVVRELLEGVQTAVLRALTIAAGLLLSLASVWWGVEEGLFERRWQNVMLSSVAALFMAGAGMWLRRRRDLDSARLKGCTVCGAEASADVRLSRLPTVNGAMICDRCATAIAVTGSQPGAGQTYTAPQRATMPAAGQTPGATATDGERSQAPGVVPALPPISGTRLAANGDLAAARQNARKRYGAMGDAVNVMDVEPDVYTMDGPEPPQAGRNGTPSPPAPVIAREEAEFD